LRPHAQYEVLQEQDWSVRFVYAMLLLLGVLGSHVTLTQWGPAKYLHDFGLGPATAGLNTVRTTAHGTCKNSGWMWAAQV